MKRIAAVLLAVFISALLIVPAFAASFDYVGPIDPVTGEPASDGTSQNPLSNRIRVSDSMFYDRSGHVFVFPLGTGINEIYSTAADGMIVNTPVSVNASQGIFPQVYLNGDLLTDADLTHLHTPGSYMVSAKEGDVTQRVLNFTIVGKSANLPAGYTMPDGFYLTDVTIDGEDTGADRLHVDLSAEGDYHIAYSCAATGINYTLDLTVDDTPPQITFEGKFDKKGRAHSAVDVIGLEKSDSVRMTLNGKSAAFPSDAHLTSSGLYTLEVYDEAGNISAHQLTILVYFDLSSLLFFALVVGSVALVAGYILYKRKKLRII